MRINSIVIPVLNGESTIGETLDSVDASIGYFYGRVPRSEAAIEVVVVDDGSQDYTLQRLLQHSAERPHYNILHRSERSSPAHARNCGVAAARGQTIFFLDSDDLFLPQHLHVCDQVLLDARVHLVKTEVRLTDPVHPEWMPRISNSLVINLAVRKHCHDQIGGFFDYHLVRRFPEGYEAEGIDVFRMIEDVYYNDLLKSTFVSHTIGIETVVYKRRPGNSFDRQYEKFSRPLAGSVEPDRDKHFRVQLANVITAYYKPLGEQ